jgi:site-specific DNA-methyltransferase (adenine-specific)
MNANYIDKITYGDCHDFLGKLDNESIDLFLSDIPYGICLDEWDVLHSNTNSALLGQSPAQVGKSGFKRRGKPINGWSQADRNIGNEYREWCEKWGALVYPKMKKGASLFVFSGRRTIHQVINAFENIGFLLKDTLVWKKPSAHHRAQRVSIIFERRGMEDMAIKWEGWRVGNLAPIFEPIAWFVKPYKIGGTITDNILENEIGALNIDECLINGNSPTNLLEFDYRANEKRIHEAQKPLSLIEFLIRLTTKEGQVILDPFMGSGTTAVAAKRLKRYFICFEIDRSFCEVASTRLQEEVETKTDQYQPKKKQLELSLFEKQEKYSANKSLANADKAMHRLGCSLSAGRTGQIKRR